jgi:fused signal recognition particle receptor
MIGIFKKTLQKTVDSLKSVAPKKREIVEKELLEEILVLSDMSYDLVEEIVENLPEEVSRGRMYNELERLFRGESFYDQVRAAPEKEAKPFVELIVGVNGAGKTTTIAKLANMYKKDGKKVMLAAGDTFRAAAIEQLKLWSEKIGVPIVFTQHGHDPSAVAYDSIKSAEAKGIERVLIDTAGRLHNKTNLQNELKKILKVCGNAKEGAPHKKIIVLDGTQGNSAIEQAKIFNETVGLDGAIITKLDGTSKGGALFSIVKELRLPILYIGTGEKEEDLIPFDHSEYINTLLDSIYV